LWQKMQKKTEQKADLAHPKGWKKAAEKSRGSGKSPVALVSQLKAGSNEAAEQLVGLYYEQIYLFMRRLGHSCQVSEDLTQETFLQAWQHIDQLIDDKALKGWLYRIAGNVSKGYWRRNKKRKAVNIEELKISDQSEGEKKLGDFEELERLKKAIMMLPMKLKEAVILHYLQHLTIEEAAKAAGVTEGTLKGRINRALKKLKKQL